MNRSMYYCAFAYIKSDFIFGRIDSRESWVSFLDLVAKTLKGTTNCAFVYIHDDTVKLFYKAAYYFENGKLKHCVGYKASGFSFKRMFRDVA